jgi:predicted metalloprotease with PDZ domain
MMRVMTAFTCLLLYCYCSMYAQTGSAQTGSAPIGSKPIAAPLPQALPEPKDVPFRGVIQLRVDATDTAHGIFHVTELLPLQDSGPIILLYPEWDTASHAPTASAVELAGLHLQSDGKDVEWQRDTIDVHAFHLTPPPKATTLTITFDYLSPRSAAKLRSNMVVVEWQRLLLYPAGWYTRDLPVAATLQIPAGLQPFTALAPGSVTQRLTGRFTFKPETLDRLVDAPVYAGRYTRRLELSSAPDASVHLDLVADSPDDLFISRATFTEMKALIVQAARVFGPPPFHHYDAIVSLSDEFANAGGIEHLDEGENNLPANYLTAPGQQLNNLDLIAHEFVHAWNGRFRQPVGLWSPTFNRPTDPSLLWVYEGQTEFWGRVLAARAGFRTPEQTLEMLALDAHIVANRPGRAWKTLADSTLDALYMPGQPVTWRDWQRREDYYHEGVLLWLDVDARLRELSHGQHGLDDFARAFFATHGSVEQTSLYTFADVCEGLNTLAPADWKGMLTRHLVTHDTAEAMQGLARAGWRLTYNSTPNQTLLQDAADQGVTNLDTSLGAQVRSNGTIRSVVWNGPAFRAGLAPGIRIAEVNGKPFSPAVVMEAIAASPAMPIHLTMQVNDASQDVLVPDAGPLRYPHLERIAAAHDWLTPLLAIP